jgi:hypothetical protein
MGLRRVPAGGKPASQHVNANSKETSFTLCASRFEKTNTHKKTRPKPGFFVEADQSAITEATA